MKAIFLRVPFTCRHRDKRSPRRFRSFPRSFGKPKFDFDVKSVQAAFKSRLSKFLDGHSTTTATMADDGGRTLETTTFDFGDVRKSVRDKFSRVVAAPAVKNMLCG